MLAVSVAAVIAAYLKRPTDDGACALAACTMQVQLREMVPYSVTVWELGLEDQLFSCCL